MGTQKILPLIRPNKGRIVTITSGLVCGGAPSRSPYVFTKYAAVGFLECLRYEMRRFGVHVSMLEPGNFLAGTKLFDNEIINRTADDLSYHWQTFLWTVLQRLRGTFSVFFVTTLSQTSCRFFSQTSWGTLSHFSSVSRTSTIISWSLQVSFP